MCNNGIVLQSARSQVNYFVYFGLLTSVVSMCFLRHTVGLMPANGALPSHLSTLMYWSYMYGYVRALSKSWVMITYLSEVSTSDEAGHSTLAWSCQINLSSSSVDSLRSIHAIDFDGTKSIVSHAIVSKTPIDNDFLSICFHLTHTKVIKKQARGPHLGKKVVWPGKSKMFEVSRACETVHRTSASDT